MIARFAAVLKVLSSSEQMPTTSYKGGCLVREKTYYFSCAPVRMTTGQNSAAHKTETFGVAGECGPGKGMRSSFFAFPAPAVRGAMVSDGP